MASVAGERHSRLHFMPSSLRNSLSFMTQCLSKTSAMDRDSLDRSSSELAVDPASFNYSAQNSGNDSALGGDRDSPRGPQSAGQANDLLPGVDNVLQSDVRFLLKWLEVTI